MSLRKLEECHTSRSFFLFLATNDFSSTLRHFTIALSTLHFKLSLFIHNSGNFQLAVCFFEIYADELVSRYTVQCTTQNQNKTPRVYKARQYTRCTCKMSSATSCSLRVPRGSYVNQEGVTEKACLRAHCTEMMED